MLYRTNSLGKCSLSLITSAFLIGAIPTTSLGGVHDYNNTITGRQPINESDVTINIGSGAIANLDGSDVFNITNKGGNATITSEGNLVTTYSGGRGIYAENEDNATDLTITHKDGAILGVRRSAKLVS